MLILLLIHSFQQAYQKNIFINMCIVQAVALEYEQDVLKLLKIICPSLAEGFEGIYLDLGLPQKMTLEML